jgi:DNA-binding NarL/FixJ family response regulator
VSSASPQIPRDTVSPTGARRSRVLIVDDNSFARHALGEIFQREPDFQVCGEAGNGHEAIRLAQVLNPDVVVLDLAMPVMNGLDAARMLRRILPKILLIMYSDIGDRYVEQQAKLIGIAALIAKAEPPGTLVSCARKLLVRRERAAFSERKFF